MLQQLCSDPEIELKPEFVFRGKGTRTHFTPPKAVYYQCAPKGSYQIEHILGMIDKLPNQFNMLAEQSFAIYVLHVYSAQLMPEI